ncbi:MAG: YveK family protein [Lachnospiraceae bacterium]
MRKDDVIEIDLRELFFVLLGKLHILILALVLGAVVMFFISEAVLPAEFESTTSIYVLNKQDSNVVTYSDLQTGTQLTKDYAELVKSRSVMEKVISQLQLNGLYEDMEKIDSDGLAKMVTVNNATDTRIISITVRDTNPARAQDIANAIRETAAVHITSVMDIEAVNVVDYAEMPMEPVSPNVLKNVVIGALISFLLAAAVIIIIYLLDDTIKSPDDIERYLGISLLGTIPLDESLSKKKRQNGSGRK